MINKIKNILNNNKYIKVILALVLGVVIFRAVKKRLDIMKVNNAFSTGHLSGVGVGGESNANIQVLAEKLFGLYYNDLTEDEDECISTIKQVPVVQIRDFSNRYNKLCVERAGNYHWWTGYNHIPTNLIADSQYFLESKYSKVESLLNQI